MGEMLPKASVSLFHKYLVDSSMYHSLADKMGQCHGLCDDPSNPEGVHRNIANQII